LDRGNAELPRNRLRRSSQNASYANFHEKAHFVKADVAAPFAVERYDSASFALRFHSHSRGALFFCDSVHYGIRLLGLLKKALQSSDRSLCSSWERGWTKFALRSRLLLDPKRSDIQKPCVSL
jgi:hypothetical protein